MQTRHQLLTFSILLWSSVLAGRVTISVMGWWPVSPPPVVDAPEWPLLSHCVSGGGGVGPDRTIMLYGPTNSVTFGLWDMMRMVHR